MKRLSPFRPSLLACVIALAPLDALADIFEDMESYRFGSLVNLDSTCARAPHRIRFSPDRSRATFNWAADITSYLGERAREARYTVLGHDDTTITMQLNGEQRRTASGEAVVWILRPITRPEGYCWGRTDWPAGRCAWTQIRCEPPAPIS
mgnify:FL=1